MATDLVTGRLTLTDTQATKLKAAIDTGKAFNLPIAYIPSNNLFGIGRMQQRLQRSVESATSPEAYVKNISAELENIRTAGQTALEERLQKYGEMGYSSEEAYAKAREHAQRVVDDQLELLSQDYPTDFAETGLGGAAEIRGVQHGVNRASISTGASVPTISGGGN